MWLRFSSTHTTRKNATSVTVVVPRIDSLHISNVSFAAYWKQQKKNPNWSLIWLSVCVFCSECKTMRSQCVRVICRYDGMQMPIYLVVWCIQCSTGRTGVCLTRDVAIRQTNILHLELSITPTALIWLRRTSSVFTFGTRRKYSYIVFSIWFEYFGRIRKTKSPDLALHPVSITFIRTSYEFISIFSQSWFNARFYTSK